MKVSICIPQYERIDFLLASLNRIERQTYDQIEVVISDDCSKDNTVEAIQRLSQNYKYPIVLGVNKENQGYDRNYRRCIELATGDYAIVIGNDDTLFEKDAIEFLVDFLLINNYPEIGYCNYVEDIDHGLVIERAFSTKEHGSGIDLALSHYNAFSFVGGLIYKRDVFDRFNTAKHDGSVYAQMYLGLFMIASGCRFFTIEKPLVLKDLIDKDHEVAHSFYKDDLPKKWSEFKAMDGGLPSVAHVLIDATQDALGCKSSKLAFRILKRIYTVTYPFWIVKYKKYGGWVSAIGLIKGMNPVKTVNWSEINAVHRTLLYTAYIFISMVGLVTPVVLFEKLERFLHRKVQNKD